MSEPISTIYTNKYMTLQYMMLEEAAEFANKNVLFQEMGPKNLELND